MLEMMGVGLCALTNANLVSWNELVSSAARERATRIGRSGIAEREDISDTDVWRWWRKTYPMCYALGKVLQRCEIPEWGGGHGD